MSEDNYIQFSPKWTMIWISFLGLLFIFGIHLEIKKAHSLNYLSYDKQMDTAFVVNPYSSRRGLFYDDYEYVVDRKDKYWKGFWYNNESDNAKYDNCLNNETILFNSLIICVFG